MTPPSLFLLSVVAMAASIVAGPRFPRAWTALAVLGTASGFLASLLVLQGGSDWQWRSGFRLGGEPLHLRLDGLSAFFLMLASAVGAAGAIYSREYWSDHRYPASAPRGRAWWSALTLSISLVLTASNGLHFLLVWEAFTVSAYFLITLDRRRVEVRRAGRLYLVASHAGTALLFAFFAILAGRTGAWDLGPLLHRGDLAPLFWLALLGFGSKAALFPLHVWLPSAHANAPSHVSAIMSGVAVKVGVYGIIRFSGWLPATAQSGWVLIAAGSVGALFGIAFALAQTDIKRLLAYCSVENVGIIMVGIGGALLAREHGGSPWGPILFGGALLHVWNHGLFKALLFFGAGSVLHATGSREMSRLGGLWRPMPRTAALFAVGALAVSGLPPLNGFVSEWLVYLGLFDSATGRVPSSWVVLPAAITLGTAGALALATFVKVTTLTFLGAPRSYAAVSAHDCGRWMRGPMVGVAAACVALGLGPLLVWPLVSRAVGTWDTAWASSPAPPSLATLCTMQVAVVGLGAAMGGTLWWRVKANGLRRGLTWDCGYAQPTARMQYTGGSFGSLGAGWFFWLLRPERRLRRPRGVLPSGAIRLERIPETVLEKVMGPVATALVRVSSAVRRLQHGRLQAYVLYVVVGLAALGAIAALGSTP